jgi:hypothetical protein
MAQIVTSLNGGDRAVFHSRRWSLARKRVTVIDYPDGRLAIRYIVRRAKAALRRDFRLRRQQSNSQRSTWDAHEQG